MGTKNVRLDEDVYERVKAAKRPDETFSEAVDRLIGGYSLVDFAEGTEPVDDADEREELADAYEEYAEGLEGTTVRDDS